MKGIIIPIIGDNKRLDLKIFFCPDCKEKLYLFILDKDGDDIPCPNCGKIFQLDFSKIIDEFDGEKDQIAS